MSVSGQHSQLNSPYGGTLIESIASDRITNVPVVQIGQHTASDIFNIATGAFSPLNGFMGQSDFQSVCEHGRLYDSQLPFTIPVIWDVSSEDADKIRIGGQVEVARQSDPVPLGYVNVSEMFPFDKQVYVESVYGTDDLSHPGVNFVQSMGDMLVAGQVFLYEHALPADQTAIPRGTRQALQEKGLTRVAGFQTRNVVHRGHEHQLRTALDVCGGLLIHPIVGWKKSGDFRPEVIRDGYRVFIDTYLPPEKVVLAFLDTTMRYAGPKEAVFHAIIRRNYGCSHFIVGRDHAGVGGFYDTYAAHQIFDRLPDLGIEILRFSGAFFCHRCGSTATDHSCGHSDEHRNYLAGQDIRALFAGGKEPDAQFLRKEVFECIKEYQRKGRLFV